MKYKIKILIGTALVTFIIVSCETIKRKKDDLADKVVSKFDPVNPDTRFNKKRFEEFFGFKPTSDITDIFCYSDEIGIDASYYFSFNCSDLTYDKIRTDLKLTTDTTNISLSGFNINYSWWDNTKIENIKPLTRQEGQLSWYLWYDRENGHIYFLTFDV